MIAFLLPYLTLAVEEIVRYRENRAILAQCICRACMYPASSDIKQCNPPFAKRIDGKKAQDNFKDMRPKRLALNFNVP